MTARELFEQSREAAIALAEHELRMSLMRERIGLHGRGMEVNVTSILDPMRKVDDLIDWEMAEMTGMASWQDAVDEARLVIDGMRAMGDVDMSRTLELIYVDAVEPKAAANVLGHDQMVVKMLCDQAFEWLDSVGLVNVKNAAIS